MFNNQNKYCYEKYVLNIQKQILQILDFFKPKSQKLSNDHILFQEYTPFKMSIKTGFFSFCDFLLYSNFWYYRSLLHYGKSKQKLGKNKSKLRIYPKNHENFKSSKPRS